MILKTPRHVQLLPAYEKNINFYKSGKLSSGNMTVGNGFEQCFQLFLETHNLEN